MEFDPKTKWIWTAGGDTGGYNQAAIFRREFELTAGWQTASIAITADSWYRLKINGRWLNDGPCRNYPNHYQYEVIDLADVLECGINRIEVIVRYFGSGTAHQIPQQAGFLAQITVTFADRDAIRFGTDASWQAAAYTGLIGNTSQLSLKQEACEYFDAGIPPAAFQAARELFGANEGPWHDLHPRDCRLLTRNEVSLLRFLLAGRITSKIWNLAIPAQKLLHPGLTTSNFSTSLGCGAAFRIESTADREYNFLFENLDIYLNGIHINPVPDLLQECKGHLRQGENLLLVLTKYPFENQKDLCITIVNPDGLTIGNAVDPTSSRICFLQFPEFHFESCEIPYHMWANRELLRRQQETSDYFAVIGKKIKKCADLIPIAGRHLVQLDREQFSHDEAHWEFCARQTLPAQPGDVIDPASLLYDTAEWTTVNPVPDGDIELVYDFGEQQCGYWDFTLEAAAGTVIDLFAVEYITPEGLVQHTDDVRNGMRYICREGLNRYTSLRRRSGRYLFVTLRHLRRPVRIKNIRLYASTYPVDRQGAFCCTDPQLNRIWEISARTVKLCMEDVYTDCPCYEQSLWLGDGRNTALFSFPVYAPWDLARRCLRLGGLSLDKYPIAGSQVPSGWDCLIPAWSFLWGLAVWDYYEETADVAFLREIFPMVLKNIEGGWAARDPECGLFSMYTWNLFEWVETDTHHPRMLYDSMLLSAAINCGRKCAEAIGDTVAAEDLAAKRQELNAAINRTWLDDLQAFPDSLRKADEYLPPALPPNMAPCCLRPKQPGPCRDISVHTSMLAILFDIIAPEHYNDTVRNVLDPRPELFKVKNMFARFYLYQCLEKLGYGSEIVARLQHDYAPMLNCDSTTTWENFIPFREHFPCRSQCHAWSAGALYFFARQILGLKMTKAGAAEFIVSPELGTLAFAEGARATVRGTITIRWQKTDDELRITASAPPEVKLIYRPNAGHHGLRVIWNGKTLPEKNQPPKKSESNHSQRRINHEVEIFHTY